MNLINAIGPQNTLAQALALYQFDPNGSLIVPNYRQISDRNALMVPTPFADDFRQAYVATNFLMSQAAAITEPFSDDRKIPLSSTAEERLLARNPYISFFSTPTSQATHLMRYYAGISKSAEARRFTESLAQEAFDENNTTLSIRELRRVPGYAESIPHGLAIYLQTQLSEPLRQHLVRFSLEGYQALISQCETAHVFEDALIHIGLLRMGFEQRHYLDRLCGRAALLQSPFAVSDSPVFNAEHVLDLIELSGRLYAADPKLLADGFEIKVHGGPIFSLTWDEGGQAWLEDIQDQVRQQPRDVFFEDPEEVIMISRAALGQTKPIFKFSWSPDNIYLMREVWPGRESPAYSLFAGWFDMIEAQLTEEIKAFDALDPAIQRQLLTARLLREQDDPVSSAN